MPRLNCFFQFESKFIDSSLEDCVSNGSSRLLRDVFCGENHSIIRIVAATLP